MQKNVLILTMALNIGGAETHILSLQMHWLHAGTG